MTQSTTASNPGDRIEQHARLQQLIGCSVSELARLLQEETKNFLLHRPSDDLPGLALFFIAITGRASNQERSDNAWACIYQQYAPLVLTWVTQHQSAAPILGQDGSAPLINAAFAKFSQALSPANIENFDSLAAILKYLKMCVHSVIADELRSRRSRQNEESLELGEYTEPVITDPADEVVSNAVALDLWQAILQELKGENEQVLIYLSFMQKMGFFLTFGDFGIAELFLLNKKWLVKQRHKKVCIS